MKIYSERKATSESEEAGYRMHSTSVNITKVTDDITKFSRLYLSHDLKTLYISDTGDGENDMKMWSIDGETLKPTGICTDDDGSF